LYIRLKKLVFHHQDALLKQVTYVCLIGSRGV
jgi:hypothetical protein